MKTIPYSVSKKINTLEGGGNVKKLNVTNGKHFDAYFKKTYQEDSVVFNEALIEGNLRSDYFSTPFINERVKILNTNWEAYTDNIIDFVSATNKIETYDVVNLWFGEDVFCQINQLFVLYMIEDKGYKGPVYLFTLDQKTHRKVIREKVIYLGEYKKLYHDLMYDKYFKSKDEILNKAVSLYRDYKNPRGTLMREAKSIKMLPQGEQIKHMLVVSEPYGLSDIQVKKIIKDTD